MGCATWLPSVNAQAFADKLAQEMSMDLCYVWIHQYHLLVLPSDCTLI